MTHAGSAWTVDHRQGSPAALHALDPRGQVGPALWVLEAVTPALVLGSSQRDEAADHAALARRSIDLVRRRSGGGAVLVLPGEVTWVDLVIPVDHPRWEPDVGRAMHWVGELWADALVESGVPARVHRGAMVRTELSSTVCFAGVGPGEVLASDGRKLVGISQRRTREAARFQTMVHTGSAPEAVVDLLAGDERWRARARAEVAARAAAVAVDPHRLVALLVDRLLDRA